MTVELLQTLSLVSYIVAVVFLAVSVALFFILRVPKLYGEVSGRTARKAIAEIHKQNAESVDRVNKAGKAAHTSGRITDQITVPKGRKSKQKEKSDDIGTDVLPKTPEPAQSNATTALEGNSRETTALAQNVSTTLREEAPSVENKRYQAEPSVSKFTIDIEMSFAESTEIIE